MYERQKKLLKIIIEDYIKTAKPVGSNAIVKKMKLSSATIRNLMIELENLGFLEKTHISSGRIPSEEGYKYYVNNLMEPKKLTGEDILNLQTIFNNNKLEISDAITKSMEIISSLTNYTSIILGPQSKNNKLKQIEVVPLDNESAIAIIVTDKGHVEHKQMELFDVSMKEISKIVELINKMLVGTPIDEVNIKLEFEIKPIISEYVIKYEQAYNAFYNVFSDFNTKTSNKLLIGKSNVLKQPEFNNVAKIKNLMEKFESDDLIKVIEEADNGIKIYIGEDSELDNELSIIKTKYNINGEEGVIAIVGPKRMEYDRVVAILNYLKENIEGE